MLTCLSATAIPAMVYKDPGQSDVEAALGPITHVVVRTTLASREDGVIDALLHVVLGLLVENETSAGTTQCLVPVNTGREQGGALGSIKRQTHVVVHTISQYSNGSLLT